MVISLASASGNNYGGGKDSAPVCYLKTMPYKYSLASVSSVQANVLANAGNRLTF
jgi:hypothetical protein